MTTPSDLDRVYGPLSTTESEASARNRAASSIQTSIFARLRAFGSRRSALSWDIIFLARSGENPVRLAKAASARLRLIELDVATLRTLREAARGARKGAKDIHAVCMADDAISALSALIVEREAGPQAGDALEASGADSGTEMTDAEARDAGFPSVLAMKKLFAEHAKAK